MVEPEGLEPSSAACRAAILPLNYGPLLGGGPILKMGEVPVAGLRMVVFAMIAESCPLPVVAGQQGARSPVVSPVFLVLSDVAGADALCDVAAEFLAGKAMVAPDYHAFPLAAQG